MNNAPVTKNAIKGPRDLAIESDAGEADLTKGGLSRSKAPGIVPNPSPGPCVKSGERGA